MTTISNRLNTLQTENAVGVISKWWNIRTCKKMINSFNLDLPNDSFEKYTKIKKQEVVLIGDSMSDLGMAENANVSFIGVNTGLHSDEFIGKSKILANNLAEIKVYSK